jgi:hypothetical protein
LSKNGKGKGKGKGNGNGKGKGFDAKGAKGAKFRHGGCGFPGALGLGVILGFVVG